MARRLVVGAALLAILPGGCGGGGNCSFEIIERIPVASTVACCGASAWADVTIRKEGAEVASPAPRCAVYLGPVSPGEVSPRRKVSPGTYRIWVQAISSSAEPQACFLDVGVWGERCGGRY
jgi:hypothetical protein